MRFLITGITGFAGTHLARQLATEGHEVFGTTRAAPAPTAHAVPDGRLFTAALSDAPRLREIVRQVQPDGLFHLAAFTSPFASFSDPDAAYRANLMGSLNVFAAVRAAAIKCRVVWIGSSDTYGLVRPDEVPVTETNVFRPLSPYAVSKAAADLAAFQWSREQGLDVVRLRPFNHTGPGQHPQFVCADFARQLIVVERGAQPAQVDVGNLDVTRDFSDVRDIVRAYVLAWQHAETGEAYNVCSGIGRSTREILDALIQLAGAHVRVVVQPQRLRSAEVPVVIGSAAKLRAATGWSPLIAWEQTLRDLLDDWRARLAADASAPTGS